MSFKQYLFFSSIMILVFLFIKCTTQFSAQQNENSNSQKDNLISKPSSKPIYEADQVDKERLKELDKQNERFRRVPDEWKKVDFKNFHYPDSYLKKGIPMVKGGYLIDLKDDRGWVDLKDIFYIDLTNDVKKEAIIILWKVYCGGSCDGGRGLIFIYTKTNKHPQLLWKFETGSIKYGCGLKSLTTNNKKITIEQFGDCRKKSNEPSNDLLAQGPFVAKDLTKTVFSFLGNKPKKEISELIEIGRSYTLNYLTEISIND